MQPVLDWFGRSLCFPAFVLAFRVDCSPNQWTPWSDALPPYRLGGLPSRGESPERRASWAVRQFQARTDQWGWLKY